MISDIHVVTDLDFVVCKICNKKLEKIDGRHTKKVHKISFVKYKELYPETPTITKKKLDREILMNEKRKEAKKNKDKSTKIIKCCNSECSIEFEVNINVSNKFTLCPTCKSNGIINKKDIEKHEKFEEAMLKKHGVKNPSNISEVQELKRKNLDKKLEENPDYYESIVEKRINTNKEIYGEDWTNVLHEKSEEGMLKIHGVKHALKKDEFNDKRKKTNLDETGYEEPFSNPDIQEDIKNKRLKDSNGTCTNIAEFLETKKKISRGLTESWKNSEVRKKREDKLREKFIPRLEKYLTVLELSLLDNYQGSHHLHKWKCLKCGSIFNQIWNRIQIGFTCQNCRPVANKNEKYKAENELAEFIEELEFDIVRGNRSLISPYELDIVIHSKKIAIEYCGLFWHNEKMIRDTRKKINDPKKYHLYKLEWCNKKGYDLITVFEDEWVFKKDIVKSRLKHILGVNKAERIHARKCEIFEITSESKNKFLDEFHIQGKDNSSICLGAFSEDILIAVMTFSKGNISKGSKAVDGVWELNRFCLDSNYRSPGIANKLLSYFKNTFSWKEIFSYADRRWSVGNVYEALGFNLQRIVHPNYWYVNVNKLKRYHRFSLRKKPGEPKDISEQVLRINEGYHIIWDCGNLRFQMENI